MNRYKLLYRPASFCTLPAGVRWTYVEAPDAAFATRPDLPQSKHRFGIIQTDRPLTADEMRDFEIEAVG